MAGRRPADEGYAPVKFKGFKSRVSHSPAEETQPACMRIDDCDSDWCPRKETKLSRSLGRQPGSYGFADWTDAFPDPTELLRCQSTKTNPLK